MLQKKKLQEEETLVESNRQQFLRETDQEFLDEYFSTARRYFQTEAGLEMKEAACEETSPCLGQRREEWLEIAEAIFNKGQSDSQLDFWRSRGLFEASTEASTFEVLGHISDCDVSVP
jgi:hypothetical protein